MANATDFGSVYMGSIPIGSASVVVVKWLNTPVCNTVRAIKFVVGSNPTYHFLCEIFLAVSIMVVRRTLTPFMAVQFCHRQLYLCRLMDKPLGYEPGIESSNLSRDVKK